MSRQDALAAGGEEGRMGGRGVCRWCGSSGHGSTSSGTEKI
jgi:hypothetical protein